MSLQVFDSLHASIAQRSPNLIPAACLGMALVLLCSMDLSQLVLAALGAVMYAVMNLPVVGARTRCPKEQMLKSGFSGTSSSKKVNVPCKPTRKVVADASKSTPVARVAVKGSRQSAGVQCEFRQMSWNPVRPVQFNAVGWDAEVDELTGKIIPSVRSREIVQQLAKHMKLEVSKVFTDVEVMGFTFSDLTRNTAFGVAVPEVDIVVCLKPRCMRDLMRSRSRQPCVASNDEYVSKLKKVAIRTCTEHLVNTGGLKFRRSAFRGQEPKVTLLAPAALGIHSDSIPIDLSINSTTPMHHAALMTECGQLDPRAQALALLVKRWAKDRGVCFAAKGHLSPYAWTLMTIYFLQTGIQDEDPLLPSVEQFEAFAAWAKGPSATMQAGVAEVVQPPRTQPGEQGTAGKKSVGQLLREFFRFYAQEFDFRGESICVRQGKRAAPDIALPLHIILHTDGATTAVAPSIEDPFNRKHNVSRNMNEYGMLRLKEELARADGLCSASTTSLSELLEPWAPKSEAEANADTTQ